MSRDTDKLVSLPLLDRLTELERNLKSDPPITRAQSIRLLKAALRRVSAKVSAQQLMIFELAALGEVPLKQVACKLDVSLMQVYLARHRVGKLFKAEVTRLRKETE